MKREKILIKFIKILPLIFGVAGFIICIASAAPQNSQTLQRVLVGLGLSLFAMIIVSDKVGKIIIRKIEKDCGLADVEYKPVELVLANANDAEKIWEMQKIAFAELFAKYKDKDTSPATETLEKVQSRFDEANTYHYFIQVGGDTVGALRIVDKKTDEFKRVSQIFVMPEYRRKGYALSAITIAESIHGENKWEAETILNERALCMFYTRMGYRINKEKSFNRVNDKMTLITFVKY